MDLTDYIKQTEEIFPPYVLEKFNTNWTDLYNATKNINLQVFNNKLLTRSDNTKWVYEVCHTPFKRGNSVEWKDIFDWWESHQVENMHQSVFAHDQLWIENNKKTGSVSCDNTRIKGYLFWVELDRKDPDGMSNLQKAIKDGLKIKKKLVTKVLMRDPTIDKRHIAWLFTSGNASTHLLINGSLFGNPITDQKYSGRRGVWYNLAHKIAGNVRHKKGPINPYLLTKKRVEHEFEKVWYRKPKDYSIDIIRQSLENIDPNIYNINSLIRQPWSKHENGPGSKRLIDDNGKFIYNYTNITYKPLPPVLLDLWWDSWVEKEVKKEFDNKYNSSYIVDEYKTVFPDLPYMKPNSNGYVGAFYNPFYNDTNPAVYININTGYMKDHGSSDYSMGFEEFLYNKRKLL